MHKTYIAVVSSGDGEGVGHWRVNNDGGGLVGIDVDGLALECTHVGAGGVWGSQVDCDGCERGGGEVC